MEHKLITGGEQYLPFARACITKLKKLGLPYVDQSYEVDGVSIKVRIEPGHEYIRIEGGSSAAYMESGQLEWSFPGELNPERLEPAKWHFLDIPPADKYLGKIVSAGTSIGGQKNSPALSEGMDSLAIGYPKAKATDPDKATKDAEIAEAYRDSTLIKKLTVGSFKASLFSGKMRLFLQAQYGAMEAKDYRPLSVGIVGTSTVLRYFDRDGASLTLGLWSHASPGIYKAPSPPNDNGSYWLINITNPTMTQYIVTAYPVLIDSSSSGMLGKLHKAGTTESEKLQCEAYLLSNATIDLTKPKEIHRFASDNGGAIAYGWKFNTNGDKASIVTHKLLGVGYYDYRWEARTIHISISSQVDSQTRERIFSVSDQTIIHGEWTDGWGTYNIFYPQIETSDSSMDLWSIRLDNVSVKPVFDFSDVSVYGYYKDDVWVPVKISRTLDKGPWPKIIQYGDGGVEYAPGFNMSTPWRIGYGMIDSTDSVAFEMHSIYDGSMLMDVSVGGVTTHGKSYYGTHRYLTRELSGGGSATTPFIGITLSPFSWGGIPVRYPSGYPASGVSGSATISLSSVTVTETSQTGWLFYSWALVIPCGDCEAVYVATSLDDQTIDPSTRIDSGQTVTLFEGSTSTYGAPDWPDYSPGVSFSYTPFANPTKVGTWSGYGTVVLATNTDRHLVPVDYRVQCFTNLMDGETGTPGGSYFGLFNVSRFHPQYDRSMYVHTSAGGRYAMSEHANSPISVNYNHRFVGWA